MIVYDWWLDGRGERCYREHGDTCRTCVVAAPGDSIDKLACMACGAACGEVSSVVVEVRFDGSAVSASGSGVEGEMIVELHGGCVCDIGADQYTDRQDDKRKHGSP